MTIELNDKSKATVSSYEAKAHRTILKFKIEVPVMPLGDPHRVFQT